MKTFFLLKVVTHPTANWLQQRVTWFININAMPKCQLSYHMA